ncbi:hypothetical protein B0T19DRAFT_74212 [Cercophora scortea]|uniref:Uncharacterized protein n=1 Tax=Cercophora scortea TaxID=314031 RepID=A0AAE0J5V1_9PEZI|nr:hypothetical protein B0T19DRAFT_74212 [Cercophora scortea]
MDHPRDPVVDFSGRSSPHSPQPPLALSDFLSQQPFSNYVCLDCHSRSTQTTVAEGEGQSIHVVCEETIEAKPELHPSDVSVSLPGSENLVSIAGPSSLAANWLETRSQLLPGKNSDKKTDWIRGWSQAVSLHGENTYCACSETLAPNRSWKGKTTELKTGVRAILLPQQKSAVSLELNACRYCSRQPSPSSPPASVTYDKPMTGPRKGLGGKMTNLFHRIKGKKAKSQKGSNTQQAENGGSTESTNQPGPALSHRQPNQNPAPTSGLDAPYNTPESLQPPDPPQTTPVSNPPKQKANPTDTATPNLNPNPISAQTTPHYNTGSFPPAQGSPHPGHLIIQAQAARFDPPQESGPWIFGSDDGTPRGDDTIARSLSRLKRAQRLLDRNGNE